MNLDKLIDEASGSLTINLKMITFLALALNQGLLVLNSLPFLLKFPKFQCSTIDSNNKITNFECTPTEFCGNKNLKPQILISG